MHIDRRELLAMGRGVGTLAAARPSASSTIRVAAIQMTAELANVEVNLARAERLVRAALARGAKWVILPEFFASGIAFHPEMARATRAVDGPPAQLLRKLAREGNAYVGGPFLAWRDGNVYNSFVLALPDGSTLRHDKDYPTFWENCYYLGGKDDGVLSTPVGKVGAALCWEFIRSGTAARLKGRVGLVIGGSGWWTVRDGVPADHPSRKMNLDVMKATPGRFARMLGVPVVHAAQAGTFVARSWPEEGSEYASHYLGEAQIVDGSGVVLARMSREDGEGVITADISFGQTAAPLEPVPESYWIAAFPEGIYRQWGRDLETGREYYTATTLPLVREMFAPRTK